MVSIRNLISILPHLLNSNLHLFPWMCWLSIPPILPRSLLFLAWIRGILQLGFLHINVLNFRIIIKQDYWYLSMLLLFVNSKPYKEISAVERIVCRWIFFSFSLENIVEIPYYSLLWVNIFYSYPIWKKSIGGLCPHSYLRFYLISLNFAPKMAHLPARWVLHLLAYFMSSFH